MKILNKTKNTVIADDVVEAGSLIDKTLGLLKYSQPQALIMKTRFGIHTFGMKFPIDVIILDDKGQVVKVKEKLKPGRAFLWNPKYNTVLELPDGSIASSKTKTDDILFFE